MDVRVNKGKFNPQLISKIYHESTRYGRYCIALSEVTFKLLCISIAIRIEESDLRIYIDPTIYQMHAKNTWKLMSGEKKIYNKVVQVI